jgi:hypothetical protein
VVLTGEIFCLSGRVREVILTGKIFCLSGMVREVITGEILCCQGC